MKQKLFEKFFVYMMIAAVMCVGFNVCEAEEKLGSPLSREDYTLQQVVVLSRHNIRSPLSGKGAVLGDITPHEWFSWSSAPSELSLRGGVLETEMGQFFRKWLVSEGLITENDRPEGNEIRIYANSKQRTLATARYFASGFLPVANLNVEFHAEYDTMDPVFNPQMVFFTEDYAEAAETEIRELFTEKINELADNYALLEEVLDVKDSESWKNGGFSGFQTDDTEFVLAVDAEPALTGSLKTACSAADALVLQYYEEPDELKAAFGHELTRDQWDAISEIKDVYQDVLFTSPLVAVNLAHPLLQEIQSEMESEGRVFTFLCGHDSNIGSVLAALGVEEYALPGAIERKTPIGCKLVFSKWIDSEGKVFWGVDLVYQTPEQLRSMPLLSLENAPAVYSLKFSGLEANQDGLYSSDAFLEHFDQAIENYYSVVDEYVDSVSAVSAEEYEMAIP